MTALLRATGVTTRLVLETALHALHNPDTWVVCMDHHTTYVADMDMQQKVVEIFLLLNVPFQTKGYSVLVPKIQHKEYPAS